MKIWYCVTSSFDNKGRVTADITATCESDEKPKGKYTSTHSKDVYIDWFDSLKKAQEFVMVTRQA